MGQKLRTMVMKRAGLCDLVAGAAKVQGPEIGGALREFLTPALQEGETPPDMAFVIELFGRQLRSFGDAMVKADAEHLAEIAAMADLRDASEQPTAHLKDNILSLRSTCQGLLGEDSLRSLGLDFNLAQNPRGVLRQAEIIQERLLGSDEELTPERWVEGSLAREEMAKVFDQGIEDQRRIVGLLVEQGKKVDTAKVRKDQALGEFDRQYIPIARFLEAAFRAAGENELADRIRPTVRQLGRNNGEGEETTEPATNEPRVPTDSDTADSDASDSDASDSDAADSDAANGVG